MVSDLQIAIGIAGIIGLSGIILLYQLILQRPSLILDLEIENTVTGGVSMTSEEALLVPRFYLCNVGRMAAKDPYVEIELINWNFDSSEVDIEPDLEVLDPDIETELNTQSTEDKILHGQARKGFTRDPDPERIYSFPPTAPAVIWDSSNAPRSHKSDDPDYPSSDLEIKSYEYTARIGAPGEIHKMTIENIIYPDSRFKIYFGGTDFPLNRRVEIGYQVACEGHAPRKGLLAIEIKKDEINVKKEHPSSYSKRGHLKLLRLHSWVGQKLRNITLRIWQISP